LYAGNNYLWAEMIACCTRCKDHTLAESVFEEWKQMRRDREMEGGVIVIEAMIAHYTAMHDPQVNTKVETRPLVCLTRFVFLARCANV
jgi:pentatricopeptide repeat protein